MEYGSAYLQPSRRVDDDAVSMLSDTQHRPQSQYRPYRPDHHRNSSSEGSGSHRTPSWLVSPVDLQQSLPPEQPSSRPSPSPNLRPSIFGNRAVLDSPYQEPVAWANSTQFRSAPQEGPKPDTFATSFIVTESSSPQESRRYFRHPRHILEPWKTGFWLRFPWFGFGALFLILILTGASAGILLGTNGMSPEAWEFGRDNAQPYVYISVFEMVMNFLILFALAEGMVIRLWRQLLHGTTLSCIHDTYESLNLWPAVRRVARLRFNKVAFACVLSALSFIRGPLFQRALTLSENGVESTQGTVDLQIAPYPIVQYFQSNESNTLQQSGVTEPFSSLLKDLSAGRSLQYGRPINECGDYCTATIKGFSFSAECNSTSQPFDLGNLPTECKSCTTSQCVNNCLTRKQNDFNPTFFSIGYKQANNALVLTSINKDTNSCAGDVHVQTCSLTQITSNYSIIISNGTIDRQANDPNAQILDEQMPLDSLLMKKYWPLAFETLFPPVSVNVTPTSDFSRLEYSKCVQPRIARDAAGDPIDHTSASCSNSSVLEPGLLANDPSVLYATQSEQSSGEDALCSLTWKDPMQDMINKMQSLAFRVTVSMATSDPSIYSPAFTGGSLTELRKDWHQSVSVTGYRTLPLYHTNRILVAFGILLSIAGVAAVVPLYNGFWELGRKVSLNPLEVARAFGTPLFEGLDGNATPEMITVERGGMSVRYGALERYGDGKRLRVEESARATVRTPWQGEIFG